MISRKSFEARIKALEQQKYPSGRVFVISVRDGEEDGMRVKALEKKMRTEHGLYENKRDILVKIRSFTDDDDKFERISDEIKIHKMVR